MFTRDVAEHAFADMRAATCEDRLVPETNTIFHDAARPSCVLLPVLT